MRDQSRPPERRNAVHTVLVSLGLLLGLAILYGSLYLLCMERQVTGMGSASWTLQPSVAYRVGGNWAEAFFRPAHAVDRWIRPGRWTPWTEPNPLRDTLDEILGELPEPEITPSPNRGEATLDWSPDEEDEGERSTDSGLEGAPQEQN